MTPAKSSLLLLSALVLLVAAFHWRGASTSGGHAAHPEARPAGAARAHGWFAPLPAAATPLAAPAIPSLPDALDALHASGRPEDAFAAFTLVTDCLFFQKEGWLPLLGPRGMREMTETEKQEETRRCTGMTQRIATSRLDDLDKAAAAGVMGAAFFFYKEGPFGDPSALITRPDDPLVQEWKVRALAQMTREAAQGDVGVLMQLMGDYANGNAIVDRNPALAFRYALAAQLIIDGFEQQSQPASPGGDWMATPFRRGLSEDEIALAQADARAIREASDARIRQERERQGLPPLKAGVH